MAQQKGVFIKPSQRTKKFWLQVAEENGRDFAHEIGFFLDQMTKPLIEKANMAKEDPGPDRGDLQEPQEESDSRHHVMTDDSIDRAAPEVVEVAEGEPGPA